MNLRLESKRLLLRPFQPEDAPYLLELNNDEEVMRYTGDKPFKDLKEALEFIEKYGHTSESPNGKYGIGRLGVVHKETLEFLGWAGLNWQEEEQEIDIGYRFFRRHWGKGFATEAGQCIFDHAFSDQALSSIIAYVHELNLGSQKVVEKLGMHLTHRFLWENREPARYYRITK
ncbi:GNAT family N-acetyltransferase [Nonlabens xiamenensis]|uniref:GNAT family N-acetyltransferase n=1 Tax=Nonlabens xiamenensis TaxID=2341043 RepID=UPI000F609005|nr:GNAT family N-acetyltransferase [Nonlabens xiamenensis]